MSILITGTSGFIASHLIEGLTQANKDFTGFDLKPSDLFTTVDLRDKNQLVQFFKNQDIHLVVHLAALTGVRPSIFNPQEYIKTNVEGSVNLLEVMKDFNVKKLVFASSSSIYGKHQEIPFTESLDYSQAISPYAVSKQSAELFNRMYHNLYKFDVHNLRFFTVYGERQRTDLAIHRFLKAALLDEEISVFGQGDMARDYTFVKDTVDGIMASINKLEVETNVFENYNLGNSSPVSLNDLLELIEEVTGKKLKKKLQDIPQGDVPVTYADNFKAKRDLKYEPKTDLSTGLGIMWNWIKKTYS